MGTRVRGKHAAARRVQRTSTPGPVTAAMKVAAAPQGRVLAATLRLWPAIPPLALLSAMLRRVPAVADLAGQVLGLDATLTLLGCIAITPLLTVVKVRAAKLRWWYGVWTFILAIALLVIVISQGPLIEQAAGNAVNWTGLMIVVLLLPMTATANVAAQKTLGPEWKRWQRGLIWFVWALVLIHLALLQAWPSALALAAASLPLLMLRLRRVRQAVKAWRAGKYETGGWWTVIGVSLSLFVAGVSVLGAQLTQAMIACLH